MKPISARCANPVCAVPTPCSEMDSSELCKDCSVPVTGTRWVDPGQGATIEELFRVKNRSQYQNYGSPALLTSYPCWNRRTNLALTGEPLTSEDVRNIAEAK